MVIAVDSPVGANRFQGVDFPVVICVFEFGDLGALGEVECVVFVEHAEGFVQAAVGDGPFDLGEVVAVGAFTDPEVAAPSGDGNFFSGHQGDGADFHDFAIGEGDFLAVVEIVLAGCRPES